MHEYRSDRPFSLENGGELAGITIRYEAYGELAPDKSNVVWICHALTANAEVARWWPGLVGEGKAIDPARDFVVCANILGSCYGSTGPLAINPATGRPYFSGFPALTIRDMVKAHSLLREHLGISRIRLLMGGSMGGYQAMEWAIAEPDRIARLFLIATSAAETPWGIAVHAAQRLAIEADPSWRDPIPGAGSAGLKAARAIGILTYRNYAIMRARQADDSVDKLDDFRAASYINYQGEKLAERFNAFSYWLLTKAMDSHNVARGRAASPAAALKAVVCPTLVIGIQSDLLCPVAEQELLASAIPQATLHLIDSSFGHDGFMVESTVIGQILQNWLA